ncbi:ATP-grasp domain-containing protein [Dyella jejuensis]|uniref:ATP-grasp domain-containing protein n=1 Tax=Dyella jejuensis TaxID=1432009 RepID=UPI00384D4792
MSAPVSECRLAIATSRLFPTVHPDDVYFVAVLEQLGIQPAMCVWDDPAVDWSAFDTVLVRTVWDYFQHYAPFLAWLDALDRLGVPGINNTDMLRWNSDKRYLLELEPHGVPIIPTQVSRGTDLQRLLTAMTGQDLVIKPTVSGGAWHTLRGVVGDANFRQALSLLPTELDYLVQPFVPDIASNGEWSLLYFGGRYSHAVLKRPAAGDYRVQENHGGTATQATPDDFILRAASNALAVTAGLGHREPAYARVDGVVVDGQFLLMELELIEPLLHLAIRPDAAERFARHIAERLQHLKAGRSRPAAAKPGGGAP